ncbi:hypothetical protein LCGC14_0648700 [marine sediment metagenome]|uniref:Calcineurin-like phosphoesterase domain-containing protein n=1 Tax=marine sediment metagenome TaxID=412755 RepID=A0A0F9QX32_9ZZZZ
MDTILLRNLRERIKPNDTLYFLGDLTFKEKVVHEFFEIFEDIKIYYIIGNHDSSKVVDEARKYCISISHLKDIKVIDQSITLCHYAMRVWKESHYNSWQLYGHSHSNLKSIGKQHDIGVDNNNFFPLSYEDLVEIMKNKQDNSNYVPSR